MAVSRLGAVQRDLARSARLCLDRRQIADEFLAPCASIFRACGGLWFQLAEDRQGAIRVEHQAQFGGFTHAMQIYSQALYRVDPVFSAPDGEPTTLHELSEKIDITARNEVLGHYVSILASEAIGDIIGFYFGVEGVLGKHRVQMCLLRHRDQPNFTAADVAMFCDIAPTLQLANVSLIHREEAASLMCHRNPGLKDWRGDCLEQNGLYGLTNRELQIVEALHLGHSNASMAQTLGISVRTVENHLRAIFSKTGATSRTQVVTRTQDLGRKT